MLERGSKVFGCFLDVRFYTVWIDGLMYKLFTVFGIRGRMWLVVKNLYNGVKAQVLHSDSSREFEISQGTGQGIILAPFMCKVYVNGLLNSLAHHSCAISLNNIRLISPSFADGISLLAFHPTFLSTFTKMCCHYSIKCRYMNLLMKFTSISTQGL